MRTRAADIPFGSDWVTRNASFSSKTWPSASSAAPAIEPGSTPAGPAALKPASAPMYDPKDVASSQSRSLAVIVITRPSASLRTTMRSMTRMICSFLSRSSSGRISPLKRLPSNATVSI